MRYGEKSLIKTTIQMSNYNPLGATLVVRPPKISNTTEAGILKSDSMIAEEKKSWDGSVEVVQVGPNCSVITPGMRVLLQSNAIMHPVMIDGEELLQVEEYSLLGYYK